MLDIRRVTCADEPLEQLVAASDAYLESLYPPQSNHAEPLSALLTDGAAFFAAYIDDEPAACGAVKLLDDDGYYGEIKRVFVAPNHRGKGLAVAIMQRLEAFLRESGVALARLEAGPLQPEALALYRKLDYTEREPFGHYTLDPFSVFMEKPLSRNTP